MKLKKTERPVFPKRAIVTAGMPYGNKELHFGHIGGVFIHADTYARFLKDRIGEENVIFVSGTDCYGSPISANYKKLSDEGKSTGSIKDYVKTNHTLQKDVLDKYEISPSLYAASALGRAGEIHKEFSYEIFNKLYNGGFLEKMSSPQFYDADQGVFLNGRQVIGKCPISGCQSDKAYADECSLGHMYTPSELISPMSTLSGKKPTLVDVTNWYFKLQQYTDLLDEQVEYLTQNSNSRKFLLKTMGEFLKKPVIYITRKQVEDLESLRAMLPPHDVIDEPKKPSVAFIFDNLELRDNARSFLELNNYNFRTGKTLVPFRLTGNIDWGITVPEKEGLDDLTFWVWPESLWAPISFTKAYLESIGESPDSWEDWWHGKDSKVYQFIGEDNIYFYGLAEMGLFLALQDKKPDSSVDWDAINLPHLIPNNHVLFLNKKASSSSEIKPPMAVDLLDHYTHEQLRMHFLSLGLSNKSVSFMPQVYMPENEHSGPDTVLKDGNLLTNVFNRLVRSCFYTNQKYFSTKLPSGDESEEILSLCRDSVLTYERHMFNHDFHRIIYTLDDFIRKLNKYWSKHMKSADASDDSVLRKKVLVDSFHGIRTALTLLHPIVPSSCNMIREQLNVSDVIWDWKCIFDPLNMLIDDSTTHELKFLEPKVDFFKKHENQYKR